jgi:hypothetical protein
VTAAGNPPVVNAVQATVNVRRRTGAVGLGLAALGLVVGCGSSAPAAKVGSTTQAASSAAGNKAASLAEVRRLASLVSLPPGTSRARAGSPALDGPALGTPESSSFLDVATYFHSTESMSAVWSWLESHPPARLTPAGSSRGSSSDGIAWSEPDRSYAVNLQLEVSLAPHPTGTDIRVDGVGEWLDPRPTPDRAGGTRLRISVAAGCPQRDGGATGVRNAGPDLDRALLPHDRPTGGLVCRYGGLGADQHRLVGWTRLSRVASRAVADQVARLRIAHEDGVVTSCPLDAGGVEVVALGYPGRPDVDLWAPPTGCRTVSNGHIVVDGGLALGRWLTPETLRTPGPAVVPR